MSSTLVCDLDGVVYLGETAVPGAGDALRRVEAHGWRVLFATNNSARSPSHVVSKLQRVAGYHAVESQIITSALVAASLVEVGPVLVMAESGVVEALAETGFALTEDPSAAATVVVGLDRGISYERIHRASEAVRGGARLVVTNRDPTYPTDRGLLPGAGACAAPVEMASGVRGVTAGKPSDAMRAFIEGRSSDGPIWMVGDRPDTDIALAVGARWRSVLVTTGVTEEGERPQFEPDVIAADLPSAVDGLVRR
ncbi:HAD-IIA family hydrolase [soil metagenome]